MYECFLYVCVLLCIDIQFIFQGDWSVSLPAGTLVKVLADFSALREDEISVIRGEVIQVSQSKLSFQSVYPQLICIKNVTSSNG